MASIERCLYAVGLLVILERLNVFEFHRDGVIFVVVFAEEKDNRLVGSDDFVCFCGVYVVVNGQNVDVRLQRGIKGGKGISAPSMSLRVSPVPTLDCMRFSIWVQVSSVRGILMVSAWLATLRMSRLLICSILTGSALGAVGFNSCFTFLC